MDKFYAGWKAGLSFLTDFIHGSVFSRQPFDENAWKLYDQNEDYTERIDLAKKYPEKLSELKAEFEQQAKSHNLYSYITWDDVLQGKIHHTKDSKPFAEAVKDVIRASIVIARRAEVAVVGESRSIVRTKPVNTTRMKNAAGDRASAAFLILAFSVQAASPPRDWCNAISR